MRELRLFLRAVYDDWLALMSGIAGVLLGAAAASGRGPLPDWTFWLAAALCLIVASFRVWRTQHRAAHPYDDARLAYARSLFAALTDPEREWLEAVAVQRSSHLPPPQQMRLTDSQFLGRDPVTGRYFVDPAYEPVVLRLLKEWRASSPAA